MLQLTANRWFQKIIRSVLPPLLILCSIPLTAQEMGNPVVIELPGLQVTRNDFNARFEIAVRMLANSQGIAYGNQSAEQVEMLRTQYLRQRANELVMLQEAERLDIVVEDAQLAPAVADFYHRAGEGVSHEQALQAIGFRDEAQLKDYLRDQERIRLATNKVKDGIIIPPGAVMTMHHDLEDQLMVPEKICLRQINVADEQTAKDLLARLAGGADFAALAREHSLDKKSGPNGGDMGCFEREGSARSDFEQAVHDAPTGQVTGPISTELGYHLILVYERIAAHKPTVNEIYAELEEELRHEKLPHVLTDLFEKSGIRTYPDRLADVPASE